MLWQVVAKIYNRFFPNFDMLYRKGITPVVTMGLLLLVAIGAFIVIFNETKRLNSQSLTGVESQGGDIEVLGVEQGYLQIRNDFSNVSIDSVKINGVSCGVSGDYNSEIIKIDVYDCINSDVYTVDVITNKDTATKTLSKEQGYERPKFVSVWNIPVGEDPAITLPLVKSGNYNFTVYWGDGRNDTITQWNQSEVSHVYSNTGNWTIKIKGTIKGWSFNNSGDKKKIIEIKEWGPLRLGNQGGYFWGAENLEITATDILDLSGTTIMSNAFRRASSLSTIPNMNNWDVSNVENMSTMFAFAFSFNQSLNNWDVSNVKDMSYMLRSANSFNQPLNNWDVSNVTNMVSMFHFAVSFNHSLNSWDVSNVEDMSSMFKEASYFNQPLNDWNTSSVIDMKGMFENANDFNQLIGNWDVSQVENMSFMFNSAYSFNKSLNSWDVSSVKDMTATFSGTDFNQPLNNWSMENVTSIASMFYSTDSFNQPLDQWNTSNIVNMESLFWHADFFNQNISMWCVEQIGSEPTNFDDDSSFDGQTSLQPDWGATC